MYYNGGFSGAVYDPEANRLEMRRRRELRQRLLYHSKMLTTGRADNFDGRNEFGQLLQHAQKLKDEGDDEFQSGLYASAETDYQSAMGCLNSPNLPWATEAQEEECLELRYTLCIKLCMTYFKMGEFRNALRLAKAAAERQWSGALQYEPNFWFAKCLYEIGQIDEGFRHINIVRSSGSYDNDDVKELFEKKKQKELENIEKLHTVRVKN